MPTLQIELDKETATRLASLSRNQGREESDVASSLLKNVLGTVPEEVPASEAELLTTITTGWETEKWTRYHALSERCHNEEALSEREYQELQDLTDEREMANAQRLKSLILLAGIREVPLEVLKQQLGIRFHNEN